MRKTTRITISEDGRDKGKSFVLTELPADQAERWFIRAMFAISRSNADISPDMIAGGSASFAVWGIPALLQADYSDIEPLLQEMWSCVQYRPLRSDIPLQDISDGINSQIEEVSTRFRLRIAVLQLHMGFFIPEATPTSDQSEAGNAESNSSTSLGWLGSWFRKGLQRS
jgi:hypothetical protein